jgi:hypothetical protein
MACGVVSVAAIAVAAWLLPGMALERSDAAMSVAAAVAALNAVLPPVPAAARAAAIDRA